MNNTISSHGSFKILLIGPLMETIGGTQVSFRLLAHELKTHKDVEVTVLSVKGIRGGGWKALPRFIYLMGRIASKAIGHNIISLHASITGVPYIGPIVLIIARLFNRPVVYRMFGGMDHNGLKGIKKQLAQWFARNIDLYLVQTQILVNAAEYEGLKNVEWFPTCRPVDKEFLLSQKHCRRFVFLGQLRPEKGLKELAEAAERLPDGHDVHVWGPWTGLPDNFFDKYRRIKFMGLLKPNEVQHTLLEYDALVLPTYLMEEGYSGVIFEAYSKCLPVIATRWRALPEIVVNGITGLLVEHHNTESLFDAMMKLSSDQELFLKLRKGAHEFVQKYSMESQANRFVELCKQVLAKEKAVKNCDGGINGTLALGDSSDGDIKQTIGFSEKD